MFETLKSLFRVKEMRRKLFYVIGMIFVIRIGSQLPVPGVDSDVFRQWFQSNTGDAFNFFDPAVPQEVPDFWYWADGEPEWGDWTRPQSGAVMPRAASRITLEITGIRVEKLQTANESDLLNDLGDMLEHC